MKTHEQILALLKKHGKLTLKDFAEQLKLTTMGVRQHLHNLEEDELIEFEDKSMGRGRPTRFWNLTQKSNEHFEDRHEILTVQLIDSVEAVFGQKGLDTLIEHRENQALDSYKKVLDKQKTIKSKLDKLAKLRTDEGYMATVEKSETGYLLIEHHCPICHAAQHCQNFCRSELSIFQELFEDLAQVKRSEHIIAGQMRCVYEVDKV
ncbi:helix-turn-helix transcriptional regulator [Marinicellulosiphila megalodicopiae]|uniref:helix-turn-helix transcriptional regulator n=1 Tax=Marinicellulosiphila megalodicopiae TaxID=2724896 RepID=UPI003BAFB20A